MTRNTAKNRAFRRIDRITRAFVFRAHTRLCRACNRLEVKRRKRVRRSTKHAMVRRALWAYPVRSTLVEQRRDFSCGLAAAIVCALTALTLLTSMPGCSATTDARGPAAGATHETRNETPGETRSRRIELRVRPKGEANPTSPDTTPTLAEPLAMHELLVVLAIGQSTQPDTTTADFRGLLDATVEAASRDGVEIDVVWDEYEQRDTAADTTASTYTETPPTLRTSSAEAALGFTTKLRRFPLPWGGKATGGGFGFEAKLLGGRGVNVLHVVGAAVMVLALIPLLRTPRRWTAGAMFLGVGTGIVFTGTLVDQYPWVTLLAGLLLVGLLGYGAYEAWRRGRLTATLDSITPVVEDAATSDVLKDRIGANAGRLLGAVKAETTASKARTRA